MSDKKLIPQNRMEEYMDWLAGNKPAEGTLKPNNRSEAFMEEIAKRLDNGTGGGGGSGFEPIDSPEAAKEFATEENLGKIAQYVGPDYDVEGNFDYVDRLTVSINEEVFKAAARKPGYVVLPTELDESGPSYSYNGLYISEESELGLSELSRAEYCSVEITSSDPAYAEASTLEIIISPRESSEGGKIIVRVPTGIMEPTQFEKDLFNVDVGTTASEWNGVLYSEIDTEESGTIITKGWHGNQGAQYVPFTITDIYSYNSNAIETFQRIFRGIKEVEGAGVFNFKFNGQWEPSIAEYGITATGAMDGDIIEINYDGENLFAVGDSEADVNFTTDNNISFAAIADSTILLRGVSTREETKDDTIELVVDSGSKLYLVVPEACYTRTISLFDPEQGGWQTLEGHMVQAQAYCGGLNIEEVNEQDKWKNYISKANIPTIKVSQKLADRLEVSIDSEKYITTVEGKGEETFTYNNGQWVVFDTAPGTTIEGASITSTLYSNDQLSEKDTEALLEKVLPEISEPQYLFSVAQEPGSWGVMGINAKSTYGGSIIMAPHMDPMFFNGAAAMAPMVGGTGWITTEYVMQQASEHPDYTYTINSDYTDLVNKLFSLVPFEQIAIPVDFNAKGITVKGTPVNGDKITITYKDGDLKAYELYRVDELTESTTFEVGDEVETIYFDTTKTLNKDDFVSGGISGLAVIYAGETGIMEKGLYLGYNSEDNYFEIGTDILKGSMSGSLVDPTTLVYSSTKGWIKDSVKFDKPFKLADSWGIEDTQLQWAANIKAAEKFCSKVPAGEKPETYYGLYKFYVSPDELDNAGGGAAIVDLGQYGGSIEGSIALSPEACQIMKENENTICKITLTGDDMTYTCYCPLDMTAESSYYGAIYMYGGAIEAMGSDATLMIQAFPDHGIAELRMGGGGGGSLYVRADSSYTMYNSNSQTEFIGDAWDTNCDVLEVIVDNQSLGLTAEGTVTFSTIITANESCTTTVLTSTNCLVNITMYYYRNGPVPQIRLTINNGYDLVNGQTTSSGGLFSSSQIKVKPFIIIDK